MLRTDPYAPGKTVAAAMRGTQNQLKQGVVRDLPPEFRLNIDTQRQGRLDGLADGLFQTHREARNFEQRPSDLRQAAGSVASFRQALWLLMRVMGIDPLRRVELMKRAMAWYRARAIADSGLASLWAKSMVRIAEAQAGRLGP